MTARAAFFTVCGGGEDYDFLLGAIEHHAEMGLHLVLDTTPPERARRFRRLPESTFWIHEPVFGSGWKTFRLRTAVDLCMRKAKLLDVDVLVYLDSDEFYTLDAAADLFPRALDAIVDIECVHWRRDGNPYTFGNSEWHARLWPRKSNVEIRQNSAWAVHPMYNGNPEHHPVPVGPPSLPVVRVDGHYRHHLHYALGEKANDEETALTTIAGWPNQGRMIQKVEWPPRLAQWRDAGIRPSDAFL
jgi:hypothetical protein